MISRVAPAARARCAASVSAFTFSRLPSALDADAGDDRHVAEPEQVRRAAAPARPRAERRPGRDPRPCRRVVCSGGASVESPSAASAPVRPTALTPAATSAATNAVLIRPASTRDHGLERVVVGDAQAVDELRRLAARLAGPRRSRGRRRARRRRARRPRAPRSPAAATRIAAASSSSSPPSLQDRVVNSSPSPSSKPNATLKFCTAWPAAPFTRLSMHDDQHELARRGVHPPADVAEVRVRDVLDLRQVRRRSAARTASPRRPRAAPRRPPPRPRRAASVA